MVHFGYFILICLKFMSLFLCLIIFKFYMLFYFKKFHFVTKSTDVFGKHWLFYLDKVKVKVAQLHPTLCEPMDYTVHGILQARKLEWVAFPFSRGSSQPRDRTQVSGTARRFFTSWATKEAHSTLIYQSNKYVLEGHQNRLGKTRYKISHSG